MTSHVERAAYSMDETIEALGLSRESVLKLIAGGHLPGAKRLGLSKKAPWLIPRRSIEKLVALEIPGKNLEW